MLNAPGVAAAVPVPLTEMVCGLPVPVLVTVIVVDRAPVAEGVNVTLKLQLAPTPMLPAQVEPLIGNSAALLPASDEIVTALPPVLVSVNACGALPVPTVCAANAYEAGMLKAPGATTLPVPDSVTVFAPALLFTVSVALRLPAADGENAALIVQDAPLASVAEQVLVVGNSVALLLAMLMPVAAAVPVLDTVMVVAALVDPTFWAAANVYDAGATPTTAVPVTGQVGAAAIHVARSSKSLAVYLPRKIAISGMVLSIAVRILVGLLAPIRILLVPCEGSALWHDVDAQLRPLTGVVYRV
jgi:hypothetical protein